MNKLFIILSIIISTFIFVSCEKDSNIETIEYFPTMHGVYNEFCSKESSNSDWNNGDEYVEQGIDKVPKFRLQFSIDGDNDTAIVMLVAHDDTQDIIWFYNADGIENDDSYFNYTDTKIELHQITKDSNQNITHNYIIISIEKSGTSGSDRGLDYFKCDVEILYDRRNTYQDEFELHETFKNVYFEKIIL